MTLPFGNPENLEGVDPKLWKSRHVNLGVSIGADAGALWSCFQGTRWKLRMLKDDDKKGSANGEQRLQKKKWKTLSVHFMQNLFTLTPSCHEESCFFQYIYSILHICSGFLSKFLNPILRTTTFAHNDGWPTGCSRETQEPLKTNGFGVVFTPRLGDPEACGKMQASSQMVRRLDRFGCCFDCAACLSNLRVQFRKTGND